MSQVRGLSKGAPKLTAAQKRAHEKRAHETRRRYAATRKRAAAREKKKEAKLKATTKKLGVEYAVARGMVGQYLKKFKVKYLMPDETALLETYTARVPSLQIIYHDINGRVVAGHWYIRYLEAVYDRQGKLIKFTGGRKSGPFFYFARTFPNRSKLKVWGNTAKNIEIPIFFTEGPFKANALARIGLAAIGLAGVYAFLKNGKLLPEFAQIDWVGRQVFIIFDNDIVIKPDVRAAMGRLVHELTNLGALPRITSLPDYETAGKKYGADDYLVEKKFAVTALDDLEVEVCKETTLLHFISSRVVYVRKLKAFRDLKYDVFYRSAELQTAFAPLIYTVDTANGKREKSAPNEWEKWVLRPEVDDLVYAPGAEGIVDNKLNVWKDWGVDAVKGDVRPVLKLIRYLLANCPDRFTWFLQWLAYPIQHPGTKLFTSILIWSSEQGVGKSLLAEIMGDIYGTNYSEISRDNLTGDFNSWAKNKQFIQGDEITGSSSSARNFADKIKAMITRQKVEINEKYAPHFTLADCANYFFTSNHVDALFLEDRDRRFFVIEVSQPKKSDSFYARLRKWRDKREPDNPNGENRGAAAFRWYLENDVDLTGFNPHAEAPITEAKRDMQDLSLSDMNRYTRLLRDDPDSVLRFKDHVNKDELFELETLIGYSNRDSKDKGVQMAMSKALRNAGFRKRQTRIGDIRRHLWAIRNREKWWRLLPSDWSEQYEKQASQKFEAKMEKQQNAEKS